MFDKKRSSWKVSARKNKKKSKTTFCQFIYGCVPYINGIQKYDCRAMSMSTDDIYAIHDPLVLLFPKDAYNVATRMMGTSLKPFDHIGTN
jgi:hypothetical protein